jgi:diguanylate cyclase
MIKVEKTGTVTRFVTRIGAFITVSVVITLLVAVSLVLLSTEHVNRTSAGHEKARFAKAMESELSNIKSDMAMVASGRSPRDFSARRTESRAVIQDFTQQMWSYFEFTSAYIVDAEGRVVAGEEQGEPSGQDGFNAIRPLVSGMIRQALGKHEAAGSRKQPSLLSPGHEIEQSASLLMHDGQRVVGVVAMPLQHMVKDRNMSFTAPLMALGLREFSAHELAQIASRQGISNFAISKDAATGSDISFPLSNGAGDIMAHMRWTPDKPGDAMFRNAVTIIAISILSIVMVFAWIFAKLRDVADEMMAREETMGKIAAYDELSGLHNRRSFEIQLTEATLRSTRTNSAMAILLLDLDRFKPVNDLHGHKVGDEVIRGVARRLRGLVGAADCVARLGGDEFAIIQSSIANPRDAALLGQK